MTGLASVILVAGLAYSDWYCSAGLVPGSDTPHSPLKISFSLLEDGQFEGRGTVTPLGQEHHFAWTGQWTLHEGQLAMIGTTRGRSFGVAPRGELRGLATVTQGDVIVMGLSANEHPGQTLRCLTYPLE